MSHQLPARGIVGDGLIDLGPDGVAAVAEVSTVSFALRTPDEQDVLAAVFGRWLTSLSGPVQTLVRAARSAPRRRRRRSPSPART
ncbi:hypothetical protein [Nonomuraea sp. NPDC050783]|uniref:hypothetical protein n=1 Tax=Nonomuraea sp. NPDC050783 TaxID=3154634 RepID=UPI00346660F1